MYTCAGSEIGNEADSICTMCIVDNADQHQLLGIVQDTVGQDSVQVPAAITQEWH